MFGLKTIRRFGIAFAFEHLSIQTNIFQVHNSHITRLVNPHRPPTRTAAICHLKKHLFGATCSPAACTLFRIAICLCISSQSVILICVIILKFTTNMLPLTN